MTDFAGDVRRENAIEVGEFLWILKLVAFDAPL